MNLNNNDFTDETDIKINDVVVVYGNLTKYNSIYEFAADNTLISIEKSAIPLINAKNSLTIGFDATSGEIAYTIDNPTEATLTATITEGDWISNIGYVEGKVTFSATANTGDQRTAKITLSYTGAEDKVVTITQKANGIATIPFAFDGGKADIENTYGLAHSGLGNDYSSAPKLKFDGNDDVVTLRFNDEVARLVFDIKGNGFSKGSTSTFKVQKSANGTDYEDLDTYTELGDKVTKVYDLSLSPSVRYIKWIYTEKGATEGGNVSLGNIRLENVGPSVTIGESKFATFAYTDAVDFSGTGVTAYTAKVEEGVVKLTAIAGNVVPANTGVIIAADGAAEYTGFITTGGSVSDNELVGVTAETAVSYNDGEKYNYILQNGAFYKANGATLKANRAYLSTTFNVAAGSRLTIVVDGETTGIKTVKGDSDEQSVYDLQGRKVAQPAKGLYITNGKKFIVK